MSKPRIGIVVSTSDPHLESAARAMLDELARVGAGSEAARATTDQLVEEHA